ncbi:GntR family transcriptional regulator [Paenibacillus antarcticus]|uniref:GntR family transcriptional regulator n=1 Tax=Paenibacillus antarcticus TaxID=253703 RepID=A0A168KX60_9BACL|nr:GntR family transcriptional regulator [Paenibacillus antarcticus]OAB42575.1 GntR family transcriptional regulator [Paenibacillus antarcticus]
MAITRKKGPLYLQIKKIIKDRILQGVYPLGSIIPSEPQLENEFNVSKMTVRNAIQKLVQEGYVDKRSGIGTKVISNTSFTKWSKGKNFTEILVGEGHKIEKRLLGSELVRNDEDTELFEMFGEQCVRVDRLYILDGQPYIHYVHFLTSDIPNVDLEGLDIQSLYDLIEEHNIELENFRDRFTVAIASVETENLLGTPEGTPLLKRLRYSYDSEGRVIEYSIGHYNTELQHYLVSYDL